MQCEGIIALTLKVTDSRNARKNRLLVESPRTWTLLIAFFLAQNLGEIFMYYSVLGFNQQKILDYKLTIDEVVLLQCISELYSKPTHKKSHDEHGVYIWVDFVTIKTELPILKLTEKSFIKAMQKFNQLNLIQSQQFELEHGEDLLTTFKVFGISLNLLQEG